MIRVTYYRAGNLFGWYNDFENPGDRIPLHSHSWDMQHNIIVLRGAVDVLGKVLETGEVMNIDHDRAHSVVALEPNTRTLHLLLHGDAGMDYPDGHVAE